jgi:hypothetical protein
VIQLVPMQAVLELLVPIALLAWLAFGRHPGRPEWALGVAPPAVSFRSTRLRAAAVMNTRRAGFSGTPLPVRFAGRYPARNM